MAYEVDFLPVGEGENSGDAIALRFGNLSGSRNEYTVAVVDAGFKNSGEALVDHILRVYKTNKVDIIVSTHPDGDHIGGLSVVLENLTVGCLWMQQPWKHTKDIADMFRDGRVTDNSVKEDLRESLEAACGLEALARKKRIPIIEPFTGLSDPTNSLYVIGPAKEYYESLLPSFRGTPKPKESMLEALMKAIQKAEEVVKRVFESFDVETLDDNGETTAENNSSVILLLAQGQRNILLTADAGAPALNQAIDYLEACRFDPGNITFVQVPHHGSQRNVGPTLLDRVLGPKLSEDRRKKTAFVSVSKDGEPKHPSKKVINAFRRRGAPVVATKGAGICHFDGVSLRPGWCAAEPLPFYHEVEE